MKFLRFAAICLLALGVFASVGSGKASPGYVLIGWQYPTGPVCIDTTTGATTLVFGSATKIEGLAFDPGTNILYGIENDGGGGPFGGDNPLVTIDLGSGAISPVGTMPFQEVTGMTFDESTGKAFALDQTTRTLVEVDLLTGGGTAIGQFSSGAANALAADPSTGQLYSILRIDPTYLAEINKTTGAETLLGSTGQLTTPALDFHPASGLLYTWVFQSRTGPLGLATLDTTTGTTTVIGGGGLQIVALEFVDASLVAGVGGSCQAVTPPTPTPPPAVGGIVELVSAPSDGPQRQIDDSGTSAVSEAALAVSGAGALLALAAGAWYARRRWFRSS